VLDLGRLARLAALARPRGGRLRELSEVMVEIAHGSAFGVRRSAFRRDVRSSIASAE
jgi:hypothetical protein